RNHHESLAGRASVFAHRTGAFRAPPMAGQVDEAGIRERQGRALRAKAMPLALATSFGRRRICRRQKEQVRDPAGMLPLPPRGLWHEPAWERPAVSSLA